MTEGNGNIVSTIEIGDAKITSILDGQLELGAELFSGITESEVSRALAGIGLNEGPVTGSLNAFLYQFEDTSGPRRVLIDAGGKGVMPGTGNLTGGLKRLGIEPADIDTVICTHLHPDHIGGLLNQHEAAFANAELFVHKSEISFWSDDTIRSQAPDEAKPFFDLARTVLGAYKERIAVFDGETELVEGLRSVPLPGHTPGHSGMHIARANDELLIWGDIIHVEVFQLLQPKAAIAFDVDKQQAVETRESILERAQREHLKVAGMHLSHPGVAHVTRHEGRYVLEAAD